MSEQFIITMVDRVGVPATLLIFIMYLANKHLPVFLKSFLEIQLELKRLADGFTQLLDELKGEDK